MRIEMQKLGRRNTCTPLDASQVQSSVARSLNREETLSEHSLKTFSNDLDVNQQEIVQDLRVPVLNMRGQPLMPTTPAKARHLLEQGKAKVVKRKPFVIQLTIATGETKQDITLGIDSGYGQVGFSAKTEKEELMSGELTLRKDVSKKLDERRMYRRQKRNKLWHREARFDNRVSTKKEGWLAPNMQHKLDSHIRLIENIKRWLPITKTTIEVASFDTQKMQNPEITGIEYQQGELQGYHIKEYLLEKFGRKCVYCNQKDVPLEIEHIIPKAKGGSSRASNLTISCRKCNLEKGALTAEEFGYPNIQKLAKESLKSTVFMNVVRKILSKQVNAEETFGYITKFGRIKYDLQKSHVNDAFVIADGSYQKRCKPFTVTQTRRNNRCLQLNRKGYKPSIRRQRYKFQPNDLIRYNGKVQRTKGIFSYGKWVRLEDGTNANVNNVELIQYGKGIQFN